MPSAPNTPTVLQRAAPAELGFDAGRLGRIREAIERDVAAGLIPGAVIGIARHRKIALLEGYGFRDKTAGTPMWADAVFSIASMTKPMVSVGIMMLAEEGRVLLGDPVSKYLPQLAGMKVAKSITSDTLETISAEREMTVQDLLRHTAGFAYGEITQNAPVKKAYQDGGIFKTTIEFDARDLAPAEQVERLAKAPLAHHPGTVWDYSLASDVLGRVVEAASGKTLSAFLDERLFRPLGMTDAAFWVPAAKMSRLAQPLAIDPATGNAINLIDVSTAPAADSGGAGAVATAADYLRFAVMMLNGGRAGETRVLSRTTVALMTSDHLGTRIAAPTTPGDLLLGTPGYTFGLGFAVRQGAGVAGVHGSQGEFMWGGYAGTYVWVDPKEELVAVYMSQATGPTRPWYRRLVKNLTYQAIMD